MERKIKFAVGEYYHVYNRGVEKRKIFQETRDYERFSKTLRLANGTKAVVFKTSQGASLDKVGLGERLIAVGAYVLMPNHFHILVKEIKEGGLTNFMKKLTTSYAMYFNKKYERVGSLFQKPFKAEHVDNDRYLKYLLAYIHLNPVKVLEPSWKENGIIDTKKTLAFAENYKYSSSLDYLGKQRVEKAILSLEKFPDYFKNRKDFSDFHKDWLRLKTVQGA
ncbi:MAG: transposase [Candidatus Yanofskybacteria bacterium]|nr:transposase [Candidatus Yanofskybacteria bacterium]